MKLYYAPGACSLSPHIVLCESGLPFELERVHLTNKQTETGADFRDVNPNGYVPALLLDDGQILTEGTVIVQYLADRVPERKLAPTPGTLERYRLQEWLSFIGTELHKNFGPLFNPKAPDDWKALVRGIVDQRLDYVSRKLDGCAFLLGDDFTVADAYLFTVLSWTRWVAIDMERWPLLKTYAARIAARPAVRAAMQSENLLKE